MELPENSPDKRPEIQTHSSISLEDNIRLREPSISDQLTQEDPPEETPPVHSSRSRTESPKPLSKPNSRNNSRSSAEELLVQESIPQQVTLNSSPMLPFSQATLSSQQPYVKCETNHSDKSDDFAYDTEGVKLIYTPFKNSIMKGVFNEAFGPLAGLNFIWEFVYTSKVKYKCTVCGNTIWPLELMKHVIGFAHQLKCLAILSNATYSKVKENKRHKLVPFLCNYFKDHECKFGRGMVQVFVEAKGNFSKLTQKNVSKPESTMPYSSMNAVELNQIFKEKKCIHNVTFKSANSKEVVEIIQLLMKSEDPSDLIIYSGPQQDVKMILTKEKASKKQIIQAQTGSFGIEVTDTDYCTDIIQPWNQLDEEKALRQFVTKFESQYGQFHPSFQGRLVEVLEASLDKPPLERKLLAMYLHHDAMDSIKGLCTELCSLKVVTFLELNFELFAWDLTNELNKTLLLQLVSFYLGVKITTGIQNLSLDTLPALVLISKVRHIPEIISVIPGYCDQNEVMDQLTNSIAMFKKEMNLEIEEELTQKSIEKATNELNISYVAALYPNEAQQSPMENNNPNTYQAFAPVKKISKKCKKRKRSSSYEELVETTNKKCKVSNPLSTRTKLRPILIDASNVAREYGMLQGTYACLGILKCIQFFIKRGHKKIAAYLPLWRRSNTKGMNRTTNPEILDVLYSRGFIAYTMSRSLYDKPVASYDDRVLEYTVVHLLREIQFPDDPLGSNGPNLMEFLSFPDKAESLKEVREKADISLPQPDPSVILLQPPCPINRTEENWPLPCVSEEFLDGAMGARKTALGAVVADDNLPEGWGDDAELMIDEDSTVDSVIEKKDTDGWDIEDLDLPPELESSASTAATSEEGFFVAPSRGVSQTQMWCTNSKLVIDHVLAGSFESAFRLLQDQIGVVNFEPFKHLFMTSYARSRTSFQGMSPVPSLCGYPLRNCSEATSKNGVPAIGCKLTTLIEQLQSCYQVTSSGKFQEAIKRFRTLLLSIPLLVVDSKQEISEAQQLLEICREYVLGLSLELERKNLPKDTLEQQKRTCEMAAYFTHCKLEAIHQILTLRMAVNLFFKLKNYKTVGSFAKRLLELGPAQEVAQRTKKILQVCEKNPVDQHQLLYNEHNPFAICGLSYKPIYRGKPVVKCPLCQSSFFPEHNGSVCKVCGVAEIGKDTIGLRISPLQFR